MTVTKPRLAVPPATIPGVLRFAAERFPAAVAVKDEDGRELTFAALSTACDRAAAAFIGYGLKPGDRMAVWAPNHSLWIIATIGAQIAGGVLVPLNTRLKGREAGYILNNSGARLLFTVRDFLRTDYTALLAGEALPALDRTVLLQGSADGRNSETWEAFLQRGDTVPQATVDAAHRALTPDALSDLLFTSGTTGKPKGAMSQHRQTVVTSHAWAEAVGIAAGDNYLVVNPFFHSFGYKSGWLACLVAGARILPHAVFDAEAVIHRIAAERVTVLTGAPTVFQSMLACPARAGADLASLRLAVTGGAVVPRQLVEAMHNDLGFRVTLTGYGLTETSGTVTVCAAEDSIDRVSQTSGRPIPGITVRSVDTDGKDVPPGTPGEILVRGFNVMAGYFNDQAATAEAIDAEGWLHTGDIGIVDADGYLRITDRKKDVFIVGGFNCYPAEIEELMLQHASIAQVAVVGVPDERLGEVPKAFVVLRPGTDLTEAELIAWSRQAMANYKVPRSVEFRSALPMTVSGKVQRFALRETPKQ